MHINVLTPSQQRIEKTHHFFTQCVSSTTKQTTFAWYTSVWSISLYASTVRKLSGLKKLWMSWYCPSCSCLTTFSSTSLSPLRTQTAFTPFRSRAATWSFISAMNGHNHYDRSCCFLFVNFEVVKHPQKAWVAKLFTLPVGKDTNTS